MRHGLTVSILMAGTLMFAAACDSGREPMAPPPADPSFSLSHHGPGLDNQIEQLIPQLFPRPGLVVAAFVRFETIEFLMKIGKKTLAKNLALELVTFTFQKYKNHQLIGNQSDATRAKLQTFVDLLFQFVGLGSAPIPPGALGPDGAVAIVGPSGGQVVTETQLAGADFPTGALPQTVIVTISRSANQDSPLPTNLRQFPVFYDFKTFPEVPQFGQLVTVAACVDDAALPEGFDPGNLRLAHPLHSDPSAIEILPLVSQSLVPGNCDDGFGTIGAPKRNLASAGSKIGRGLFWLMMGAPRDLSATERSRTMMPGGLGGRTGSFSTFGAVDFSGQEFVPYQEQGYSYLQFGAGQTLPSGFEQPGFVTTGWSTGDGAFGSGGCSLDGTIHTPWSTGTTENPVEILLRKRFSGSAQNVHIQVAVDNDVRLFVNGTEITNGFVLHEGCAFDGSPAQPFDFEVSNELLQATGNLVVVEARDRGVISYVDIRVVGDLPVP